jgi:hypothetical protein
MPRKGRFGKGRLTVGINSRLQDAVHPHTLSSCLEALPANSYRDVRLGSERCGLVFVFHI